MSSRKLLILTGVVVALFAFIFLFERKMPTTADREQKGELYWDLPEDQVESIRIDRGTETVELVKSGEAWRLVRPEAYPAETFAASDLASQIADLKKPGGDSEAEGKPEDYGLAKPSAKVTFVWKDPEKGGRKHSRTLEIGLDIPGTDVTAARVPGDSKILFVPASLAASVKKPADDFKSKEVFAGATLDVTGIDVARGRGRLTFAKKSGIWWLEQPISDLADRDVVDGLANDLSTLRVSEFVPRSQATDLSALGLAPPVYRITLTDAKGGKHVLDLGSTRSDGNSVYAAREGQVFTIGNTAVDDLSKEAVAFRDRKLVRFERSDVQGIAASVGTKHRAFSRQQAGWSLDGRAILASAADDLMTSILDLESSSFLDDRSSKALAARPAEMELEVRLSTGGSWRIALSPYRGEYAATVSRRPEAFSIGRDKVENLRDAIEKAAAAPAVTPSATPTRRR
ncbi:MAG TPA: DUF4340 domain-containing protein [Thermoanaerobaculia bacterium]|nr:DUF4340 domain-containing protein [Thermoanaerobaculia bacterium]